MSVLTENVLIFSAYMSPLGVALIRVIQPIRFARIIRSAARSFNYRRPPADLQAKEEPSLIWNEV